MKRLTEKHNSLFGFDSLKSKKVANKLGQLEDIEEELGIDLITLFELKKRHKNKGKIYVITHDGKIADYTLTSYLDQINFVDEFIHIVSDLRILTTIYYFKDYGKTWALTKEELVK